MQPEGITLLQEVGQTDQKTERYRNEGCKRPIALEYRIGIPRDSSMEINIQKV